MDDHIAIENCVICNSSTIESVECISSYIFFKGRKLDFTVNICSNCGHIFSKKVSKFCPYADDIEKYYDRQPKSINEISTFQLRQAYELLELFKDLKPVNYLEIGSSNAMLLRFLLENHKNINATLYEPSGASDYLKSLENIRVYDQSFLSMPNQNGNMDILVLSHCLEHFHFPNEVLTKSYDCLGEDGILYIEVPDGLRYDQSISYPLGFFHIHNFTCITLSILLEKCGFDIVDIDLRDDYPGMRVISRKSNKGVNAYTLPDQVRKISTILSKSWWAKYVKSVNRTLKKLDVVDENGKILIYACGLHTKVIFDNKPKWKHNNNVYVTDRNFKDIGYFEGKEVLDPSKIDYQMFDNVIVSSYAYQNQIVEFLTSKIDKNKIIYFYDNIFAYAI